MKRILRCINTALLCGLVLSMMPADLSAKPGKKGKKNNSRTETVDYIVIGSCAGAVAAKRLSDDKKTSVLLLEVGDDNNTNPILVDSAQALTASGRLLPEVSYQGVSIQQPQLFNASYPFGMARILGGGSSHDGIQVVKGTAEYWQKIADIVGDDWSPDKVFARYKALETYQFDGPGFPDPTRGTQGPWTNVSAPFNPTPDAEFLLEAFAETSGFPPIQDYNNPATPLGPFTRWDYQEQFDKGYIRESAAFAFLGQDVVDPKGNGVNGRQLTVKVRAHAMTLLWDENDSNKVIGVRYSRNGKVFEAFANKEVIVSGGMLSASFLQLSGIGPEDVLRNANVKPRVINENVGRHLINHVGVQCAFVAPGLQTVPSAEQWAIWGTGAFLPGLTSERTIQWIVIDGALAGSPGFAVVFPILITPKSEGTLFIQDNDFTKIPLFNPNYLSDPADLEELKFALRTQVLALDDFFAANPSPEGNNWFLVNPSREVIEDDAALENFIRFNLGEAFHYVGQTRMGFDSATSVVDSRGRVHGVKNLRVADVSILPIVPDGNTCTPAILCGWTISEFILEEQATRGHKHHRKHKHRRG